MYKTIMVPTEGTGFDREAIRVALRLAAKSDAVIHLVRVTKSAPLVAVGSVGDGLSMSLDAPALARDRELSELYMLASECREVTSTTIVTALEEGPIGDVLEGYSARIAPDLIVISSHGRHGIARLSLGSVTDALIRRSHVPVLVVKPEASYLNPRAAERFKRIVIPLDGSLLAEQVLGPAAMLANLEYAEIALLQVIAKDKTLDAKAGPFHPWWERQVPVAQAYLNGVASSLRGQGHVVSTDIVLGNSIAESIASFARMRRAQAIAIATHGRSGINRVVRGSVADELTRTTGISLLVIRPTQGSIHWDEVGTPIAEGVHIHI